MDPNKLTERQKHRRSEGRSILDNGRFIYNQNQDLAQNFIGGQPVKAAELKNLLSSAGMGVELHLKGLELYYLFDKSYGHDAIYASAERLLDRAISVYKELYEIDSLLQRCKEKGFAQMIASWHTYIQKGIIDKPKIAEVKKVWETLDGLVQYCIKNELYYEY